MTRDRFKDRISRRGDAVIHYLSVTVLRALTIVLSLKRFREVKRSSGEEETAG
ncbi:MAG TPA: hypothetical protein VMV04_21045 [Thermodesulfobacteriota bacterium]|nr:hypothetical protein [Thermodesulfobacteriota bacterium]